jgi:hypothetical protein
MWQEGFELAGVAGGREVHAYFDMWPVGGDFDRISGIVLFPQDRVIPLADAPIGLAGPRGAVACAVQLTQQ